MKIAFLSSPGSAGRRDYKKSSDNPAISRYKQEKSRHRGIKKELKPYKIDYTEVTRKHFCLIQILKRWHNLKLKQIYKKKMGLNLEK